MFPSNTPLWELRKCLYGGDVLFEALVFLKPAAARAGSLRSGVSVGLHSARLPCAKWGTLAW